jgi:hypothetical protein
MSEQDDPETRREAERVRRRHVRSVQARRRHRRATREALRRRLLLT